MPTGGLPDHAPAGNHPRGLSRAARRRRRRPWSTIWFSDSRRWMRV